MKFNPATYPGLRYAHGFKKPLCIDLFCGLGGWAEGFLAEGYDVVGFDIERHDYGTGGYPGDLVIQDVLTLHGSQFKDAAVIVASPPCQEYSYMAMPWSRGKKIRRALLGEDTFPLRYKGSRDPKQLTALFKACFRIAKQAGVPLVVENVRGARPWVGKAKANYGSFFLWGDVPQISGVHIKRGGFSWSDYDKEGYVPTAFNGAVGRKVPTKGIGSRTAVGKGARFTTYEGPCEQDLYANRDSQGIKQHGSGHVWYRTGNGALPSKSPRRKAAAAQIAKIPFPFASAIARHFYPR